ncbi:MAG: methyltransferase domain-containing protein [Patescibacteria group bacterium]|jgi:ubiquinone/menaquinone biosynthesis C-methylase UbiE
MIKSASGNALLNPVKILTQANIGFGETVADLGTGAQAHFAIQAAHLVGERGRVYGVDILKSTVKNLASQAKVAGLHNIVPVWSNLEIIGGAKKIASDSVDAALLINILFQSKTKKENILKEAYRMIKPGGRLVIIDWKKRPSPMGPQIGMRISPEELIPSIKKVGFHIDHSFEPGEHHWGLIVLKP